MADDLLRLHSLVVTDVTSHEDGSYLLNARGVTSKTPVCEKCGSGHVYGHGTQEQRFVDVPTHGQRVLIHLARRRFRCQSCQKTYFEPIADLDSRRLATARLVAYVRMHCLRRTFADLSREVGLDDQTIRNIFDDYVVELAKAADFKAPSLLGIDEVKVVGKMRAVITNVEKNTLFDMLLDRNKATLLAYFSKLPDREEVRLITMDMWSVYRPRWPPKFPHVWPPQIPPP